MMMTDSQPAPFAAAVYGGDTSGRQPALALFVARLKAKKVLVGGILQEEIPDADGKGAAIDAVDIRTGTRVPIMRKRKTGGECGLDVFALTDITRVIRDAITDRVDLLVVEKFGGQEQQGEGLLDDIMQAIAEGIPLLIAVPEKALPIWRKQSGGLGVILPFDADAFYEWWLGIKSKGA